ncbi:hypothetical protein LCGC14_1989860 [marine sediment metagenome]|uniref:Uncharacterized protein n=1 Tax=marine sediment metagenome TaxID=412755 RepID=A0A0F9I3F8_9ZZZZ
MFEEVLEGLHIAKDIAFWCTTLEEFKKKLDNKIELVKEIIDNEKIF